MWPFGFDILIKIFAILWQIVKQIIFFAYILHFWGFHPPSVAEGNMVTPVTCDRFVAEGNMVTPVTCDRFFVGAKEVFEYL